MIVNPAACQCLELTGQSFGAQGISPFEIDDQLISNSLIAAMIKDDEV